MQSSAWGYSWGTDVSLIYKPLKELSDEEWAEAHKAFYSLKLTRKMGGSTDYVTPPLQEFYNAMMDEIEAERLIGWAIIRDGEYIGHTVLVNTPGEWEIGVALANEEDWGSGVGIRAGLYALRFAFEELGAQQVIAFAYNPDGEARGYIERVGFRPMMNFLMMPVEVWNAKWKGKVKS